MTSDRIEALRNCNEWQCPNWCTQPPDEGEYQGHFSEWRLVLTRPAVNQDVHVYAQAYRAWDAATSDPGGVEVSIRGEHAVPGALSSRQPEPGEVAQLFLDSPDLNDLIDGLQDVQALADMTGPSCEWMWAWDTAEAEYDALPDAEDEDQDEDEYADAS